MCKGIAIAINDKDILMNTENSKHTEIVNFKEDEFLKVNIIYNNTKDEKYRIEVDDHDESQVEFYKQKCFTNPDGTIINSYLERLNKFIKENELLIFKLFCSGLMQSATTGKNNFNIAKTGDNYFSSATTGDNYFSSATTGDNCFDYATTGDNYFDSATTGDNCFHYATTGDNYFNSAKTGKMFIRYLKLRNSIKYTRLIMEFSETKQKEYDLVSFCNWLIKRENR